MLIGCNSGIWNEFTMAVPGAACYRQYRDTVNDIPAQWPAPAGPAGLPLLSIRPHPDQLFSGVLDAQIRQLVASAPQGAMLTAWHEAPGLYPQGQYPFLTAQAVRSMHVYLHGLCQGTNVAYGNIIMGDPVALDAWIPKAGYPMDWYGFDIYQTVEMTRSDLTISFGAVEARLAAMEKMMVQRGDSSLVIGETNTPYEYQRPAWFQMLAEIAVPYNVERIHTFFKPGGSLGGAWQPDDHATIWSLRNVASNY